MNILLNKKRCFTVMVIPHSEESTISLRIPLYLVQIMVVLVILVVAGLCVLVYSYLDAAAEAKEIYTLRQVNRAQEEEINALSAETKRLMEQVEEIDELVALFSERLEIEMGSGIVISSNSSSGLYLLEDELYSQTEQPVNFSGSNGVLERTASNILLLQTVLPEHAETLGVVDNYIARLEAKPSIWPARGRISSGFGMREIPYAGRGYQFHAGIDIVGSYGSPIYATAHGEVVFSGYRGSFGNLVIIDHGHGYETYYAHLSGFTVTAGDLVQRGQLIGYMGSSGRTTGVHLHYEVHHKGLPVNPYHYMKHE